MVRRGFYKEGLVIEKPLEIIGEGTLGDVVVEANGRPLVSFRSTMGRIANLTLRQVGAGDWDGVDIGQGRLALEGCDIASSSLSCITIHHGADPLLRRNRIHHGKTWGVLVFENGLGTVEDNEISDNSLSGLGIKSGSNPVVRRNRIRDNRVGVLVDMKGLGTLEENEIFDNAIVGVQIATQGNSVLRRNKIQRNGVWGVRIHEGGAGTINGNDLRHNKLGAFNISEDSKPNVRLSNNQE